MTTIFSFQKVNFLSISTRYRKIMNFWIRIRYTYCFGKLNWVILVCVVKCRHGELCESERRKTFSRIWGRPYLLGNQETRFPVFFVRICTSDGVLVKRRLGHGSICASFKRRQGNWSQDGLKFFTIDTFFRRLRTLNQCALMKLGAGPFHKRVMPSAAKVRYFRLLRRAWAGQ